MKIISRLEPFVSSMKGTKKVAAVDKRQGVKNESDETKVYKTRVIIKDR